MSILGVAIVGCGVIGLNHVRAVLHHSDLRITALVDPDPAATERLAVTVAAAGAELPDQFLTLEDALDAAAIDLVVVCTPSGLHVPIAAEALAAHKHVVIEKPLDVSVARAKPLLALAEQAERAGLSLSVISQHRFDPASVVVARAVHSGAFGRVTSATASVAWWRSQEYYDSGNWRGTWDLDGGGALMNQGVHTVDLLLWFLGKPVEISAQTACLAHHGIEVEDVAVATVRFESGALAVLHATTAAYPGLSVRIQVHGDEGSAIIDDDQLEYFCTSEQPGNRAAQLVAPEDLRGAERGPDYFLEGHLRQYDDIVNALRQHRRPGVGVEEAFLALAVVRAVYLSARLGHAVVLDDVLDGTLDDAEASIGV